MSIHLLVQQLIRKPLYLAGMVVQTLNGQCQFTVIVYNAIRSVVAY